MSNSAQLEREAEETRARLARTLDELRDRITPGQLVDQAVDYARDSGGGDFVRNLGRQMVNNPLPVCLIGAGIAWLALANGKGSGSMASGIDDSMDYAGRRMRGLAGQSHDSLRQMSDSTRDWADRGADATSSAYETATDRLGSAYDSAKDNVGSAYDSARDSAASAYDLARDTAASAYRSAEQGAAAAADSLADSAAGAYQSTARAASRAGSKVAGSASAMGQSAAGLSRDLMQFCADQPLVLAGIGLAIGAAIGAALPSTEAEDRLMGDTSDELKERAQNLAAEQYDKAKAMAEGAMQGEHAAGDSTGETSGATAESGDELRRGQPSLSEAGSGEASLVPSGEEGSSEDKQRDWTAEQRHGAR
jgi:hypothetical protein